MSSHRFSPSLPSSRSFFPHLAELSITHTTISAASLAHLLRNSPHLRALALATLAHFDAIAFLPSGAELLHTLDVFVFDILDESVSPLGLAARAEATLVDCLLEHEDVETVARLKVLLSAIRYAAEVALYDAQVDTKELRGALEGVVDKVGLFVDQVLQPGRSPPFALELLILPTQLLLLFFSRKSADEVQNDLSGFVRGAASRSFGRKRRIGGVRTRSVPSSGAGRRDADRTEKRELSAKRSDSLSESLVKL